MPPHQWRVAYRDTADDDPRFLPLRPDRHAAARDLLWARSILPPGGEAWLQRVWYDGNGPSWKAPQLGR